MYKCNNCEENYRMFHAYINITVEMCLLWAPVYLRFCECEGHSSFCW